MAIITSYADDPTTTDDDKFLTSNSAGITTLTPASNVNKYVGPGWTIASDSWSYNTYSSATNQGIINTNASANTRYSIGMRVKFTQPTLGIKYGYIVAVAGSTITVSFVGGTVLSNEAITLPFYSSSYAPNQFPLDSPVISTGYSDLGVAPNTIVHNGNRSYTLTFNSVNLTTTLSPGFRLRTTRTVAAPIRSTLLNGTTQFYNRTSVAGMTFTDDFVAGSWIKPTSYAQAVIISRFNGTSGWRLNIESTGQVTLAGFNAGSGNFSFVQSVQSVPLGKWVHIAAQIDMSTFTATTTTSYVMFDGADVPVTVARAGTNPTAIVQAGNLEVGSNNGGLLPFPGKIAQVFVSSAKITQANVQAMIPQGITSALITSNNIVSAYSFDNSINDLNTTNANNLTANGSAVATNADSPFGGQADGTISSTLDYSIVQSVTFSTNTTVIVQVPEGCTIPASGNVSSVSYSPQNGYNFPRKRSKWVISSILRTDNATTSNANFGSFLSGGFTLNVPLGSWVVGQKHSSVYNATTTTVAFAVSPVTLTGLTLSAGVALTPLVFRVASPSAAAVVVPAYTSDNFEVSTPTQFTMYTNGATASAGISSNAGDSVIFAENGWL